MGRNLNHADGVEMRELGNGKWGMGLPGEERNEAQEARFSEFRGVANTK